MARIPRPVTIQSLCLRPPWLHNVPFARSFSERSSSLTKAPVTDEVLTELAAKPLHPLTLADLIKHGRPPISSSALFSSANFTLSILPARLAHRIQSLRNLPFIVVTNPHISKIHSNYMHSLGTLLPWAEREINSLEDEIKFTECMADLVQTHNNTISILARGFLEARKYISPKEVTRFLDEHLRARIGTRLIAEQHIALHFSSQPHHELSDSSSSDSSGSQHTPTVLEHHSSSYIGVIDTDLRPASIIRHCESVVGDICEFKYGVRPRVTIAGEPDYTFAHIPVHLEYIITELLKNAFRAVIEKGAEREPVEITIAPLPEAPETGGRDSVVTHLDQGNLDLASMSPESHLHEHGDAIRPLERETPGVTIRIRDRGGGIAPENYGRIWDYSFTTFNESQASETLGGRGGGDGDDALNAISGAGGGSSLAGLGYGLPLGRAYAEYFGGGIAVQSLWGWGTDVYLSLRGVGRVD
ncbi:alpha-ketoacid dehydrogenase kinase [Trichodelitschia bisporula]|uniref:Protein-serine/threonine kinase n=1 Tax=Trichodelitschia bisporula TaxID=703511 RepID=A0A6G1I1C2_9PEZI|nr:alpha-ketoacid dehydrogenase kinase [Trichodelitschia bisporula]